MTSHPLCLLLSLLAALLLSTGSCQDLSRGVTASPQCPLAMSWSTTFPDTSFIDRLYLSACQLIAYNNSNDWYPLTSRIVGIDLTTGAAQWTYGVDLPYSFNTGTVVVASPSSPSRLFIVTSNTSRFDVGCTRVQAMAYNASRGLTPLWTQPVCGVYGSAQLLTFTFPSRELLLLVTAAYQGLPSFFVTLDASTGQVLHRAANVTTVWRVTQLGTASDGLFAVYQHYNRLNSSVAAYALSDSGEWTLRANVSYSAQPWLDVQYDHRYNTQTSIILPLQHAQQRQLWQGWDLRTGKKAWDAGGDDLFTGKWAAAFPGFYPLYPGFVDQHPLNASWLLVTACASNGTGFFIYQYGILDTWTGNVTVRSPLFPPLLNAGSLNGQSQWWAVGEDVIVTRTLESPVDFQWHALDARSLSPISSGRLSYGVGALYLGFLSVTKSSASAYGNFGAQMRGSTLTAFPPHEESAVPGMVE